MNSRTIKISILALVCLAAAGVFLLSHDNEPPVSPTAQNPIDDGVRDPAEAMYAEATDRGFVDSERVALEDGAEPAPPPQLARLAVTGRVVNGQRAAVAGAKVSLHLRHNIDPTQFGGRRGFGAADFRELFRMQQVGEPVTTASDGGFRFETAAAFSDSVLAVLVRHQDYALESVNRNWTTEDGALSLGDIVVSQGGTIIGHVIDEGDVSIRDAAVRAVAGIGGGPGRGGRGGRGGFSGGVGAAVDPGAQPAATTDAMGSFRLLHVRAGNYSLEARAEGFPVGLSARVDVKDGEQVDAGAIRLEHGAQLTGTVTDGQGRPIAGALVKAELSRRAMFETAMLESIRDAGDNGAAPANGGGRGGRGGRGGAFDAISRALADDSLETKTSGNGQFRFDAVARTGVRVSITHDLFIDEERDPVNPTQTPHLQVQMERRLVVEGVVLDERTGKPIDVYGIQARRIGGDANAVGDLFGRGGRGGGPGANRGGAGGNRGTRGNRGNADASSAAPTAEELARQQERDNRNADREAQRDRQRAFVQGYLGASGEVPRDTPPPTRHEEGRFVIDGLLDGEYLFDIDAPGYVKMAAGPLTLERRQDRTRVTFRMAQGIGGEGIVIEEQSGQPIAGARVELMLPELAGGNQDDNGRGGRGGGGFGGFGGFGRGGGQRSTIVDRQVTGTDGRFQLRPQRDANYVLRVSKNNFLPYTNQNLRLGQAAVKLEVALLVGARVHGNVVGLNAGEAARVVLSRVDGDRHSVNVNPATAAYEVKGLDAGSYFVRVERDDGEGWQQRIGAAMAMRQGEPDLVLTAGADVAYNPLADKDDLGAVEGSVAISLGSLEGLEVRLQSIDDQPQAGQQDQPGDRGGFRGGRMSRFLRSEVAKDGTYKIESIPPSSYFLEVSRGGDRGGSILHRRQINVLAGPAQRQDLRLLLGSLEMDAKDAEGKPVDRARVNLVLSGDAVGRPADQWPQLPSYRSLTLRDGKLVSGEVEIGTYLYSVSGRNLPTKTGEIQIVTGAPSRVEVQLGK